MAAAKMRDLKIGKKIRSSLVKTISKIRTPSKDRFDSFKANSNKLKKKIKRKSHKKITTVKGTDSKKYASEKISNFQTASKDRYDSLNSSSKGIMEKVQPKLKSIKEGAKEKIESFQNTSLA